MGASRETGNISSLIDIAFGVHDLTSTYGFSRLAWRIKGVDEVQGRVGANIYARRNDLYPLLLSRCYALSSTSSCFKRISTVRLKVGRSLWKSCLWVLGLNSQPGNVKNNRASFDGFLGNHRRHETCKLLFRLVAKSSLRDEKNMSISILRSFFGESFLGVER
ncbi:hypothetical protein KM043_005387 [Ampulex compressa]|nr:hypothetical protein KM043_005387 [Ampulex compressa]